MDFTPVSGKIDITDWQFNISEVLVNIDGKIGKIISEALRKTFDDDPPWLTLAASVAEGPADPLTLRLLLPLGLAEFGPPEFDVSLRELVLDEIPDDINPSGLMPEEARGRWMDIAKALNVLASDIETEVQKCQDAADQPARGS